MNKELQELRLVQALIVIKFVRYQIPIQTSNWTRQHQRSIALMRDQRAQMESLHSGDADYTSRSLIRPPELREHPYRAHLKARER
jgi:hypothetical protein